MTRFSPKVEKALKEAGWYPGRDVSADFDFYSGKTLFPEALKVFKEFGYLVIAGRIFMDIDESITSLKIRCRVDDLTYSPKDIDTIRKDPSTYEMLYHTNYLAEEYDTPFTHICSFKNNGLGEFDEEAFMSEKGEIYVTSCFGKEITSACLSPTFDDFLHHTLDFESWAKMKEVM